MYEPIDCSLHDRIEAAASLRRRVAIVYEDGSGARSIEDTIADWFTRAGAEFLKTGTGAEIRLDHIRSITDL